MIGIKSKVPSSGLRRRDRIVAERKCTSQYVFHFFRCSHIGVNVLSIVQITSYLVPANCVISNRAEAIRLLNRSLCVSEAKITVSSVPELSDVLSLHKL